MKQLLILLTLFISLTTFGQTSQTEEVCPEQSTPEGWIIINKRICSNCCGSMGQSVVMKTIKKIDSLPSGTILEICSGQVTPKGWIIISFRMCQGCCSTPSNLMKVPTIKKL